MKSCVMWTMVVVVAACWNSVAMAQPSSDGGAMSFTKASKTFTRYKQWTFGGRHKGSVYSSKVYTLLSRVNNKVLHFKKNAAGGDIPFDHTSAYVLDWTDNTKVFETWAFSRKDKASKSPIRYGERIAIQPFQKVIHPLPGKVKYIRYARRSVGVDVRLTNKQTFEWAFLGGKPGMSIATNDVVVLYNLKLQQPLIHAKRKGKISDISFSEHAGIEATHHRVAKNRAAVKFLLMPGVAVGK